MSDFDFVMKNKRIEKTLREVEKQFKLLDGNENDYNLNFTVLYIFILCFCFYIKFI